MTGLEALGHYADRTAIISSRFLEFDKTIHFYLPPGYDPHNGQSYALLVLNDGQDMQALNVKHHIWQLHQEENIHPFIIAAVPATKRMKEYGTAGIPDYAGRGDLAKKYSKFIVRELMPYARRHYNLIREPRWNAIAGFSLGGLSALDLCWNYPDFFGRTGVFSGSLWWRRHSENNADADIDRIMHSIVREGEKKEGLKFWFEAGTEDETSDRNNNGIIDAIDDTLDLMHELTQKGYDPYQDIRYEEIEGGQHNFHTWAECFPIFVRWAFSK